MCKHWIWRSSHFLPHFKQTHTQCKSFSLSQIAVYRFVTVNFTPNQCADHLRGSADRQRSSRTSDELWAVCEDLPLLLCFGGRAWGWAVWGSAGPKAPESGLSPEAAGGGAETKWLRVSHDEHLSSYDGHVSGLAQLARPSTRLHKVSAARTLWFYLNYCTKHRT